MDPDKILNAVADLINGEIDHTQAEAVVDIELAKSNDLEEVDKESIRVLIRDYSGSGEILDFTSKISEILSKSPAVVKYADVYGK